MILCAARTLRAGEKLVADLHVGVATTNTARVGRLAVFEN
jgi:hypothetical protein